MGQRSCRRRIDGKKKMANNGHFGGTGSVFFQRELWGVFLKKNTRPTVISPRSVRPYKEYRKRSLLRSGFYIQLLVNAVPLRTLAYRMKKSGVVWTSLRVIGRVARKGELCPLLHRLLRLTTTPRLGALRDRGRDLCGLDGQQGATTQRAGGSVRMQTVCGAEGGRQP